MTEIDPLQRKLRLSLNPALINKNEGKNDSLYSRGWVNAQLTPHELAGEINQGVVYCCELSGARNSQNFLAPTFSPWTSMEPEPSTI